MRVSVVIPCFNSLKYLPDTLDAVLAQELPGALQDQVEILLVDDGGTDDLAGWLGARVATRAEDRVRVVRQDNAGVAAARNLGIASSTGDLVTFCDSDDVWLPTALRDLFECFEREPGIGLAYGAYEVVEADGAPTGQVRRSDVSGQVWEQFLTANPVGASGVMVTRAALEQVGVFAENRDSFRVDVEDWELWIRIAAVWPVGVTPAVVYRYRRHDQNSSTDIESLDAAYRNLLDVVFTDVGADRAAIRPMATARIEMLLAWQCLNERQDPRRALEYLRSAVHQAPELRRTPGYWRLRTAATALAATGEQGYRAMRSASRLGRRVADRLRR